MKNKTFEQLKEELVTEYDFNLFEFKDPNYNKKYFVSKITAHDGFYRVYYQQFGATEPFLNSEVIVMSVGMHYYAQNFIERLTYLIKTYTEVENNPRKLS